ncbi:RNA polymerase sigma factor [Burkholderia cenocepacia]|nr:RNA polymerase sigma factor [Burkholderia cenocepacia]
MTTPRPTPRADTPLDPIIQLLALAGEQGYLTHADLVDALPPESDSPDALDVVRAALADIGIAVLDEPAVPRRSPARRRRSRSTATRSTKAGPCSATSPRHERVDRSARALHAAHARGSAAHARRRNRARPRDRDGPPSGAARDRRLSARGRRAARASSRDGHDGSPDDDDADAPVPARYDTLQAAASALREAVHAHGTRSAEYRDARNHVAALLGSLAWVAPAVDDAPVSCARSRPPRMIRRQATRRASMRLHGARLLPR